MISDYIKLSKDSLIYGISGAITQLIGIILLPILTRIFSPSDYGIIDVITTFSSIVMIIMMLGLNSSTQRYYFDSTSTAEKQRVVSTAFWFLIFFSALSSLLLFSVANQISQILFGTFQYSNLLKLTIVALPLASILVFGKDNLRLLFSPWKYNFLTISNTIIRIIFVIYLVVVIKRGLIGNFEAALYTGLLSSIIAIIYSKSLIKKVFSFDLLKKLLNYGIPLMFAGLAYWIISFSNRIILAKLSSLNEVGLYSVGNRLSSALLIITSAFSLAWSPFIFALQKQGKEKEMIVKTLTYFTIFLLLISLLISIFSRELLLLITTQDYVEASKVVGILTVSLTILGLSSIMATGLTIVKKTKYITISSFVAAGVNIFFNFILIPHFDMTGAAIASLISYICLCVLYYIYTKKFYNINYEISKILKIFIIFILFIIIGSVIQINNLYISIFIKIIITILSVLSLFIFKIFNKNELNYLIIIFYKIKNKIFKTK